jgi:hypothetical protein
MLIVSVSHANDGKHKLIVQILGGPTLRIGAVGYGDFTQTNDVLKKQRYLSRHFARENWSDPTTKGFWARWLLWNKPTLELSKTDISNRFPIIFL